MGYSILSVFILSVATYFIFIRPRGRSKYIPGGGSGGGKGSGGGPKDDRHFEGN